MSRPASKKGKGKKAPKKKTPKQIIAELTEQNEVLQHELTSLKTRTADLTDKLTFVVDKLLCNSDLFNNSLPKDIDIHTMNKNVMDEILEKLIVKRRIYNDSLDCRIDLLENKVTTLSGELAKVTKKVTAYEHGLNCIVISENIDDIKDKVYQLQLIAGQEYHSCSFNDPENPFVPMLEGVPTRPDIFLAASLENAHKLQLLAARPHSKLPGETRLYQLLPELKLYVIQELSIPKKSGADWRMLAERLGMDLQLVEQWQNSKLPAGHVFSAWSVLPEATVRQLHRHLTSPQMRCTVLGKKLSDYYDVC